MGMRRVCCETMPKNWWFFCGLSMCETMATPGKPVTFKLLVNIYPCGTQNHIFNTNFIDLLLYSGENCDQHRNYISTNMPLPPCVSNCEPDDWYLTKYVGSFHRHSGWGATVPKPLRLV